VWKAGQKILEEFEDLVDVRLVQFKGAVECSPIVLVQVEFEAIKVRNAAIHSLDHLRLELQKSGIVKWDPDVADESLGWVVSHGSEAKLKFVWLGEDGVNEYRFLSLR
jgi:hypothetical protein